jgi:hypothetical protein
LHRCQFTKFNVFKYIFNTLFNIINIGALNTNRTCDLPLRRGLLYPLSYQGANRILR